MKISLPRLITALIATLGLLAVSGCSVFPPATAPAKKELISKLPLDVPQREAHHKATLMVFAPETRPIYDTVQMAYMSKPYQIDYFSQHEWGETPSQMLHPLLAKALEDTHAFSSVLTPSQQGQYTYALRTEIVELIQDFTSEPATLQLSLRMQLSDGAANRVIATREISLREPMLQKTPYAGVEAANNATAKALQDVAKFVLEKTE